MYAIEASHLSKRFRDVAALAIFILIFQFAANRLYKKSSTNKEENCGTTEREQENPPGPPLSRGPGRSVFSLPEEKRENFIPV